VSGLPPQTSGSPPSVSEHRDTDSASAQGTAVVFDPVKLDRMLQYDQAARIAAVVALLVGLIGSEMFPDVFRPFMFLLVLLAGGGWVWMAINNARVARQLGVISEMIETDPPSAEAMIGQLIGCVPLERSVRLLLHQRLARLRQRQARFMEAAAVSRAVLSYPLRALRPVWASLLLVLADTSMRLGDLASAWNAITQLHQQPVNLVERLQLLAVQTEYEITIGADDAALAHVAERIRLAELLPAAQCGLVHDLLATAAARQGRTELTDWLEQRAHLLISDQQRRQLPGHLTNRPDPTDRSRPSDATDQED